MRRFLWGSAVALIWALAAGTLAAGFTVPLGVFAAVSGALAGLLLGGRLAASRLRLPVLWLGALASLTAVVFVSRIMTGWRLVPAVLGPNWAFLLGELLAWFGAPLVVVGLLRASTARRQGFIVAELAAVGAIFAGLFAAHRGGFINRPYFLVDPLWARGFDPLPVLLAIGVGVAGLLLILALHRGSRRRSFVDLALLLGLLAAVFLVFPIATLKDLPPPGGKGGSSKGKGDQAGGNTKGAAGQGGQGTGQGSQGGTAGQSGGQGSSGGAQGVGQGQEQGGRTGSGGEGAMSSFSNQSSSNANAPVAVVLFRDDYDPPIGYYYFRQTAFSQYNGQRLVQDTSGRADKDVASAFPQKSTPLPSVPGLKELPGGQGEKPYFKALETTVALMAEHARPFLLINPLSVSPKVNPDPKRFQRAYDAKSLVLLKGLPDLSQRRMGSKAWDEKLWKHYTQAPTDARYAQLTGEIVEFLRPEFRDKPLAQALAVKFWLDKNGTYSLQSSHESAADPVADFLFGDKTGHCVYFAHSACLLMRSFGVPARVGAGYAVEARNRGEGSSLLVRERDAHAWPEIYLEGLGWIPLDISPEKTLAPPEDAPDQGLQQMLGEMVRQGAGNPKDEQKAAGRGDLQEAVKKALRGLGVGVALLLAALLALLYAVKLYRRVVPFYCKDRSAPRVAYRAGLDRLADAGHLRRFGQTREEFARSLSSVCPSLEGLTVLHLERALGSGRLRAERGECLRLYLATARESVAAGPWWRRLLGFLDPTSWLRVK